MFLCLSNINMSGDADLEIEEAFRRAQKAHNNKAKLVASLKTRYNKVQHNYVNFIMYTIFQKFGGSIWQMNGVLLFRKNALRLFKKNKFYLK